MKKQFLLDTNILMRSPNAIFKFDDNDVAICYTTLRELDELKFKSGEVGYNAREAIRTIFAIQEDSTAIKDVPLSTGGKFSIVEDHGEWETTADDVIIQTAKQLDLTLVTSDVSMYLKAKVCDCKVEIYRHEAVKESTITYTGRRELSLSPEFINSLYKNKEADVPPEAEDMKENEYAVIKDYCGSSQSVVARRRGNKMLLVNKDILPYGIKSRNVGQLCALDALMAPASEIPLVFLIGPAGTAKTFLSMAAGLQQVEKKKVYTRMLLLRPNTKFDDDIGYLKGDEMEKITPLLRPCLDNLESIIAPTIESTDYAREKVNQLFGKGLIEGEALAYIRGRSIANNFVVVDEAQNSTPSQMLGIISRASAGAKFVITGDPDQIDNPKVDKKNNGLVFAAEKMMSSPLCAQIGFTKEECERSALAAEASKLLIL